VLIKNYVSLRVLTKQSRTAPRVNLYGLLKLLIDPPGGGD